jgi:hypothetical protein
MGILFVENHYHYFGMFTPCCSDDSSDIQRHRFDADQVVMVGRRSRPYRRTRFRPPGSEADLGLYTAQRNVKQVYNLRSLMFYVQIWLM